MPQVNRQGSQSAQTYITLHYITLHYITLHYVTHYLQYIYIATVYLTLPWYFATCTDL